MLDVETPGRFSGITIVTSLLLLFLCVGGGVQAAAPQTQPHADERISRGWESFSYPSPGGAYTQARLIGNAGHSGLIAFTDPAGGPGGVVRKLDVSTMTISEPLPLDVQDGTPTEAYASQSFVVLRTLSTPQRLVVLDSTATHRQGAYVLADPDARLLGAVLHGRMGTFLAWSPNGGHSLIQLDLDTLEVRHSRILAEGEQGFSWMGADPTHGYVLFSGRALRWRLDTLELERELKAEEPGAFRNAAWHDGRLYIIEHIPVPDYGVQNRILEVQPQTMTIDKIALEKETRETGYESLHGWGGRLYVNDFWDCDCPAFLENNALVEVAPQEGIETRALSFRSIKGFSVVFLEGKAIASMKSHYGGMQRAVTIDLEEMQVRGEISLDALSAFGPGVERDGHAYILARTWPPRLARIDLRTPQHATSWNLSSDDGEPQGLSFWDEDLLVVSQQRLVLTDRRSQQVLERLALPEESLTGSVSVRRGVAWLLAESGLLRVERNPLRVTGRLPFPQGTAARGAMVRSGGFLYVGVEKVWSVEAARVLRIDLDELRQLEERTVPQISSWSSSAAMDGRWMVLAGSGARGAGIIRFDLGSFRQAGVLELGQQREWTGAAAQGGVAWFSSGAERGLLTAVELEPLRVLSEVDLSVASARPASPILWRGFGFWPAGTMPGNLVRMRLLAIPSVRAAEIGVMALFVLGCACLTIRQRARARAKASTVA
jgi:hypothetical protein